MIEPYAPPNPNVKGWPGKLNEGRLTLRPAFTIVQP